MMQLYNLVKICHCINIFRIFHNFSYNFVLHQSTSSTKTHRRLSNATGPERRLRVKVALQLTKKMCEMAFIAQVIHSIFCIFASNVLYVSSELIYCWLLLFNKS